jgi:hypothetical protein
MRSLGTAAIVASVAAPAALAQPVQWRVEDGGNGHWYEERTFNLPATDNSIWAVNVQAESVGGHLATLASAGEALFVANRVSCLRDCVSVIGGYQVPGATEPGGGWAWVTGEPMVYLVWRSPEPENACRPDIGCQNVLCIRNPRSWFPGPGVDDAWTRCCQNTMIVEWSADCNADGFVDKGQVLAGQLPDANNNGIPDGCETPCGFRQQPDSQVTVPGATATFTATFARVDRTLQWRLDGVNLTDSARIVGTNNSTLSIASVTGTDQGIYDCIATSPCGTITSAPATLSCKAAITTHPEGGSFIGGQQVTLSVVAANASGASYRWRKNGINLFNGINYQGVSTPTLVINADEPSQTGTYSVAITNVCGITISNDADVEVTCPADFNVDGGVDGQDMFEFFDAWSNGLSSADLNFDGGTDGSDVNAFYERWENGC